MIMLSSPPEAIILLFGLNARAFTPLQQKNKVSLKLKFDLLFCSVVKLVQCFLLVDVPDSDVTILTTCCKHGVLFTESRATAVGPTNAVKVCLQVTKSLDRLSPWLMPNASIRIIWTTCQVVARRIPLNLFDVIMVLVRPDLSWTIRLVHTPKVNVFT